MSRHFKIVCIVFILLSACSQDRYSELTPVHHLEIPDSDSVHLPEPDLEGMLSTFQQVGDLYTMTYVGDFDALITMHHEQLMEYLARQDTQVNTQVHCSMFSYASEQTQLLGRNYDNRRTELLVGLFYPYGGYRSLGLIPMTELGFTEERPFDPSRVEHREILLYAPLMTVDGINEKGVVVTVASASRQSVRADTMKPYRYLLHLKRNILDHAQDVGAAIEIAKGFNLFDNGKHSINHHILLADPSGRSVVLEWYEGEMQVLEKGDTPWMVITNTDMYQSTNTELAQSCRRYAAIESRLSISGETLSWQDGMDILGSAEQVNQRYELESGPLVVYTEWSAMFDLKALSIQLCLRGDFERVYQINSLAQSK